jgi:hypothetical protein
MRDLGQMLAHVDDAEIEIGEGPCPPERSINYLREGKLDPRRLRCSLDDVLYQKEAAQLGRPRGVRVRV